MHNLLSRYLSNSFLDIADIENDDKQMREFRNKEPRGPEQYRSSRQTIMCSATIPQRKYFAEACYRNGWTETIPEIINLSDLHLLPESVTHEYIPCDASLRLPVLNYILRKELLAHGNGECNGKKQVVVFVDDEAMVETYKQSIEQTFTKHHSSTGTGQNNEAVCVLTNELDIDNRKESLERFRLGECLVLLCSDLVARGIDIPATSLVIQMALPKTAMEYLHRAGRTGRMNRSGLVISFANEDQVFVLQRFMNELGVLIRKRELRIKR